MKKLLKPLFTALFAGMVCTGAKIPEDVTRAVEKIAAELRDASLMA